MRVAFVACLLLVPVSFLSAQPAKAKSKESSTKQSAIAGLKPEAASANESREKAPADPAICVKPGDADASQAASQPKSSPAAAAKSTSDGEASADSGRESSAGFMKDKLKLSLGGKSDSDSVEPQQCGVDEEASQAKQR
jgi:hypothetical protein